MNVLILGSDRSLVGAPALGDAVERHRVYGQYVDHLDIVVYTARSSKLKTFVIAQNVIGYPSNSISKLTYYWGVKKIIRQICRNHKPDIVVCQDPFIFALVGIWVKKKYKAKLQINFHGDFWQNPAWKKESFINPLFEKLSYWTIRRADAIRVVSEAIADKVSATGIPSERVCIIPTPVQKPRAEGILRQYNEGKKYIVSDVRLVVTKNIFFMIDVFAKVRERYPDLKYWIIGEGPLRQKIEEYLKEKKLEDSVFLLGLVPHQELGLYFQKASMQLLLSRHESFGKVIVEAGLWGCPTIATSTTGAKSIIEPEQTGLLIPLEDDTAAVVAMEKLLTDSDLRQRLGLQAAERYQLRFERQAIISKIIDLWQKLSRS